MIFPMDSSTISMTVAIVLLVMMSAYFSATETAFSCLNKIRMTTGLLLPWTWWRTMTG